MADSENPGLVIRMLRWASGGLDTRPDSMGDDEDPQDLQGKTAYDILGEVLTLNTDRLKRYKQYEDMDETDLSGSVLDLYAEDATQLSWEHGKTVWISCPTSKKLEEEANNMLKAIRMEDEIEAIARDMCKMGDNFERVIYAMGKGVMGLNNVPPSKVTRVEDDIRRLKGFQEDGKTFKGKSKTKVSYPWDYVHFRLRGKHREGSYGTSILANAFRPWRQLIFGEDQQLQYRINRQPDRNLHLIDIGTQDEIDGMKTVNRFRKRYAKTTLMDPASGKYDHKKNPMTPIEDIFLGIKKDSQTRVEKLSGSSNVNDITDLEFYRDKYFSSVRAPKAFFGFEGDVNAKATLSNQSIRFARGVKKVQRGLIQGIRTLVEMDLMLKSNGNPEDTELDFNNHEYQVMMTPPSYLEELDRLELFRIRTEVSQSMIDIGRDNPAFKAVEWTLYVMRKYLRLSDTEIKAILKTKGSGEDEDEEEFDEARIDKSLGQLGGIPKEVETAARNLLESNPELMSTIDQARRLWSVEPELESDRNMGGITEDEIKELKDMAEKEAKERDG